MHAPHTLKLVQFTRLPLINIKDYLPCMYKNAIARAISRPLSDIETQAISELLLAKEALM